MFYSHVLAIRICLFRGRRCGNGIALRMVDDVARSLDPLSGAVEVRDNVDCANDCVGRYVHGHGSLDDGLESQTNGGGAAIEKSGGLGMAVHGGVIAMP